LLISVGLLDGTIPPLLMSVNIRYCFLFSPAVYYFLLDDYGAMSTRSRSRGNMGSATALAEGACSVYRGRDRGRGRGRRCQSSNEDWHSFRPSKIDLRQLVPVKRSLGPMRCGVGKGRAGVAERQRLALHGNNGLVGATYFVLPNLVGN